MSLESTRSRNRMIFDLPAETQLAIRLRAVKTNKSTAQVICEAVQNAFAGDLKEAESILSDQNQSKPVSRKRLTA